MGKRVAVFALKALDLIINLVYFWTDSTTVLKWILSVADHHKKTLLQVVLNEYNMLSNTLLKSIGDTVLRS